MRHVLYTQRHKARAHMEAMEKGFPGARISLDEGKLFPGDDVLHIVGGLQFGALDRMKEIQRAGAPFIFYDRAYFGGGPGSDRLRITAGAYQKHLLQIGVKGRFQRLGVELKPWRAGGGHILLVPPSPAVRTLFSVADDWEARIVKRLEKVGREVRVSHKGDPIPLEDRLRDCWCVVTWTSNVAVDAIVAGIPAVTSPYSAAAPVSGSLLELETIVKNPIRPAREAWAESLAWGQFSLDEIRSGHAKEIVMEGFR